MARIGMDPQAWIDASLDQNSYHLVSDKEVICGTGKVMGQEVAFYVQQPRINQGFISSVGAAEILSLMELAQKKAIPLIAYLASPGVSVEEGIKSGEAYTKIIAKNIELSGHIPQLAMVMGTTMGAPAYSATLMDFVICNKARSTLMVTGPAVIEKVIGQKTTLKELGGSKVHAETTGIADRIAPNIQAQLEELKVLLSILPANHKTAPRRFKAAKPSVQMKLPTSARQAYNINQFIAGLVDESEFFEIKAGFAKNILTGFARIKGQTVAVVANQSTHMAGAIDYLAARKAARFIRLCDNFNFPLINLIDVPGFMPGEQQEHNGLLRYGAQMCQSMQTTTPRISLVVRRCYGAAAFLMMQTRSQGGDYVMALEGASIAIMGYAGAKTMLYPEDGLDRSQEYYSQYEDPKIAQQMGIVDEIIAPHNVRDRMNQLLEKLKNKKYPTGVTRKHLSLP